MAIKFTKTPTAEIRVGMTVTTDGKVFPPKMTIVAVSGRYLQGRTAAAMKPWEAEGMSRATWYRRRKEKADE